MHKEAFEPTGLIPRSIIRTFDRFRQQLLPGTEQIAIQEYRISRYQILVSIKALCTLIFVPFLVTYTVKFFFITPITEHFWDYQQGDIFLNSYQEKRAFNEMHDFSEKIFFESLVNSNGEDGGDYGPTKVTAGPQPQPRSTLELDLCSDVLAPFGGNRNYVPAIELPSKLSQPRPAPIRISAVARSAAVDSLEGENTVLGLPERSSGCPLRVLKDQSLFPNQNEGHADRASGRLGWSEDLKTPLNLQISFQKKSFEVAEAYNKQSILAITCLLGDFVTLLTLYILFVLPQMKPQIIILKSFLTESLYSLSDTTKSFLLILGMDLLVGFHSPRGWEIFLESALRHFGLPENESFILLFVALFPVFLDTVFKYWIFRYLNKISPSTVVTYHSMLE